MHNVHIGGISRAKLQQSLSKFLRLLQYTDRCLNLAGACRAETAAYLRLKTLLPISTLRDHRDTDGYRQNPLLLQDSESFVG